MQHAASRMSAHSLTGEATVRQGQTIGAMLGDAARGAGGLSNQHDDEEDDEDEDEDEDEDDLAHRQ